MDAPAERLTVVPCGVDTGRFAPGRTGRAAARTARGCSPWAAWSSARAFDTAIRALAAAARRRAGRRRRAAARGARPRPRGAPPAGAGARSWASVTGSGCVGQVARDGRAGALPLGRRRRCPPPGTSRSGSPRWRPCPAASRWSAVGGRRPARHGRGRRHRAPGAAPRPGRGGRRGGRRSSRPRPGAPVRRGRRAAGPGALRLVPGGRRHRGASTPGRPPAGGSTPAPPPADPARPTATSVWLDEHRRQLDDGHARPGRPVRAGRVLGRGSWPRCSPPAAGCSRSATAAAPPRRSTSPPSSSAASCRTGARSRAIALCAESSSLTAILNDYGTRRSSPARSRRTGAPATSSWCCPPADAAPTCWPPPSAATTSGSRCGPSPAPSPTRWPGPPTRSLAVRAGVHRAVQEVHLVAVHALCAAMDRALLAQVPA